MTLTVESNEKGRVTIPAEVRAALQVEGKAHWTLEIKDGAVVLRPAVIIPREDLWAYTPEHLAKVQRARQHAREGRAYRATAADLEDLMHGNVTVEALEERLKAKRDAEQPESSGA